MGSDDLDDDAEESEANTIAVLKFALFAGVEWHVGDGCAVGAARVFEQYPSGSSGCDEQRVARRRGRVGDFDIEPLHGTLSPDVVLPLEDWPEVPELFCFVAH